MRQHFHRCRNLRVVVIEASELSAARKGGSVILDELCGAKDFARCVGLADCDVLTHGQKRELLVARATELRERTGGEDTIGGMGGERGLELRRLAAGLIDERAEILAANRRLVAEATAAFDAVPDDFPLGSAEDFGPDLALQSTELRAGRLDAIERALEAMGEARYGLCARCEGLIDLQRLRASPDTRVCRECAKAAS